jgi:Kef-type K+ transport system membrane component KefB
VLALTAGLIAFKSIITTLLGPLFGLSRSDSVRTGLLLAGGGEFAFVVLTLADKLDVLPDLLAKILVGVVVISMALTPTLSSIADKIAGYIDQQERKNSLDVALQSGESSVSTAVQQYSAVQAPDRIS